MIATGELGQLIHLVIYFGQRLTVQFELNGHLYFHGLKFSLVRVSRHVQRGMAFTNLSASASKAGCTLRTTLGFWTSPVSSDKVNFTTTLPSMPCSRASCG